MSDPVGGLAEEVAQLAAALREWALRGTERGEGSAVADLLTRLSAGVAQDEPECRICPLCQFIAAVRQTRPETAEHLLSAGASLTAALRSVLAGQPEHVPTERARVQHIDVT